MTGVPVSTSTAPGGRTSAAAGTGPATRIGADTLEWPVWSTTARLVVTRPEALDAAHTLVAEQLAAVDRAASRFRTDSEINAVHRAAGMPVQVSPLLAELIAAALDAARATDGDVDPTVGAALTDLGYDRDLSALDRDIAGLRPLATGGFTRITVNRPPTWRQLHLDGRTLRVPAGIVVDLGASAKAFTADRCARLVAERLDTGVLVSLGGDIATAGPGPAGGWQILVQDLPGDPAGAIALPAGAAVATSSTVCRTWRHGERAVHHILNPRTCLPADPCWRTVTVAAFRCVDANALSTAAVVRGASAPGWLDGLDIPARLVSADLSVHTTRTWPQEDQR